MFSLGAWSPPLPAGFRVSCGTQGFSPRLRSRVRDSHPLSSAFPDRSPSAPAISAEPSNPTSRWFGLRRFRSPLLAASSLFLGLLRCFSSPGSPVLADVAGLHPGWVSPFGHPRLLAAAHASPELFAVYHVLLRHVAPRHPPYALSHCCQPCDTEMLILSLLSVRSRVFSRLFHLLSCCPLHSRGVRRKSSRSPLTRSLICLERR